MITTLMELPRELRQSHNEVGPTQRARGNIDAEAKRVTIVGTGLGCASWAANFLAHGADVIVAAPEEESEETVRFVAAAWPMLSEMGLAPGASTKRLTFQVDLRKALAGADLVLWCRKAAPNASFPCANSQPHFAS
jgi:D-arabinose 1-dehydrogenase-like Zn-dependent alcohol dehydrogenase